MKGWGLYGVLLLCAAALALAAGGQARRESPVPSVSNHGPMGAALVFTWLRESGFDVRTQVASWESLPLSSPGSEREASGRKVATRVIAAPRGRNVTKEDAERLVTFVERGGRLVLLAPFSAKGEDAQPELARAFGYERPAAWRPPRLNLAYFEEDPAGTNADVLAAIGPLEDAQALRVTGAHGIDVTAPGALPVARTASGPVGWYLRRGAGEVWIFAGADLVENRRLELGGNLAFWHSIASRGPLVFDEYHHGSDAAPAVPVALWVVGLQLVACFGLLAFSRAQRLGPARPEQDAIHRSMREYLASFAWLTRRARVEPELCRDLHARFRLLLSERQGIPVSLSDEDAARELQTRCQVPAERTLHALSQVAALSRQDRVAPRVFAKAARELARVERIVSGRSTPALSR